MENNPNPHWDRIRQVLEYSGEKTVSALARRLGLKRGENLYQIKRGNYGISRKLATLITEEFPEINKEWLLEGEGEFLIPKEVEPVEGKEIVLRIRICLEGG